jgi:hypothetical protein
MFVTRTELAAAVEDIRREQQQNHIEFRNEQREMHAENRGMLERIHERVDALWERRQRLRE